MTGSAHVGGGRLRGDFTVKNEGPATSSALTAAITLLGPKSKGKAPKLTVADAKVHALAPGAKQHFPIKVALPASVKSGHWSVVVCAGRCARIGSFTVSGGGRRQKVATAPNAPTLPAPTPPAATPDCIPSTGPIAYNEGEALHRATGCGVEYWGYVPSAYDASTPMPLLVWMHGCGGEAEGDAYTVGTKAEEEPEPWLTLSLGGRDGGCWNPLAETEPLVMAALADFEAHFNVDHHRVYLGGYSSGGDLAYRTGFRHSSTFAALLIENSTPFRDTESTPAESLSAASVKFHIAHLAHTGDMEYPIATVQSEIETVEEAGFEVELIERPGGHSDGSTDPDLRELLLPEIERGWTSP